MKRCKHARRNETNRFLNGDLHRLHLFWCEWDLYTRKGGPVEFAAKQLAEWKETVLKRIADTPMGPTTRETWLRKLELACAPSPAPASGSPAAARLARRYEAPEDCPTWHGATENEPERKVVGLFWCARLGRWAIRIQTRRVHGKRTNYVNTNTHALSWGRLAMEIDHLKCALIFQGHLSLPALGTRTSSWNSWQDAKEKLECGAVDLDPDNPLHAHLSRWLARMEKKWENLRRFPDCTLRDFKD